MKEISLLIRELRSYPDNAFAYPAGKLVIVGEQLESKEGLVITTSQGGELGFIETGDVEYVAG